VSSEHAVQLRTFSYVDYFVFGGSWAGFANGMPG